MSEPFIGEIRMFAGNFAPRSWAYCDGQLLAVSQYDALFSLLGTIYGGDGRTTFGLPDFITSQSGSKIWIGTRNLER
jgi:microcystin-dependent protein